MSDRRQINFRADDEFLHALKRVRDRLDPLKTPSATEAIRRAIFALDEQLERKLERKRNGR